MKRYHSLIKKAVGKGLAPTFFISLKPKLSWVSVKSQSSMLIIIFSFCSPKWIDFRVHSNRESRDFPLTMEVKITKIQPLGEDSSRWESWYNLVKVSVKWLYKHYTSKYKCKLLKYSLWNQVKTVRTSLDSTIWSGLRGNWTIPMRNDWSKGALNDSTQALISMKSMNKHIWCMKAGENTFLHFQGFQWKWQVTVVQCISNNNEVISVFGTIKV